MSTKKHKPELIDRYARARPKRGKIQNSHPVGDKLDAGKVRAGLVCGTFGNALLAVSAVGTFGAQKYTPSGWLRVPNAESRYLDAAWRHLLSTATEVNDGESDMDHLAHATWNLLAVLELRARNIA